jgi:hypothetical protein
MWFQSSRLRKGRTETFSDRNLLPPGTPKNKCDKYASVTSPIKLFRKHPLNRILPDWQVAVKLA